VGGIIQGKINRKPMYNPLALISQPLMAAILKSPKLFVREYYERGSTVHESSLPLLLTCYDKENEVEHSRALFHLRQLKGMRYAFLYDSEIKRDREKLFIAATQPAGYRVFINMLASKWKPPALLRGKIHEYMMHNLPWWNYDRSNQLHLHLKDRYGKLYVQLSWKANRAEVILEEIENFSVCATT
jgi:hypothetical protein